MWQYINIYTPKNRAWNTWSKTDRMKMKNKLTTTVGDFNAALLATGVTNRQNNQTKNIGDLKNTL